MTKKPFTKNKTDKVDQDNAVLHKAKLSPAYYDAAHILKMMSQKRGSINNLISTLKNQRVSCRFVMTVD